MDEDSTEKIQKKVGSWLMSQSQYEVELTLLIPKDKFPILASFGRADGPAVEVLLEACASENLAACIVSGTFTFKPKPFKRNLAAF